MDTTAIILEAILTVIAESGLKALGRPLKKATKRIWKHLHKNDSTVSADPSDTPPESAMALAEELETLARRNPMFKRELEAWKISATQFIEKNSRKTKAGNHFIGIANNSTVTQINRIG